MRQLVFLTTLHFLLGSLLTLSAPVRADPRRTHVVEAVEQVAPAVVSITTQMPTQDPFAWFYGSAPSRSGEGSGVVIDADGVVLTNAHVVERASRITAIFSDGTSREAILVGLEAELDLAVLQIRGAKSLQAVAIGSSADLMLGEPVIAIGNPFGLGHTVTTGVVSAKSRSLETDDRVYQDFIQTDASINPGNSGGPLLNAKGELIGINTAIQPDAEGIGFAIPVDRAIKVARDLVRFGAVQIPWLGLDLNDVYIRGSSGPMVAIEVERVHPGTAAAAAGIVRGDFISEVDDRAIQGRSDLNAYLASFTPGRTVSLAVHRQGRSIGKVSVATRRLPDTVVQSALANMLGIELGGTAAGSARTWAGVRITHLGPSGQMARARVQVGDVITAIDGQPVTTKAEFMEALARAKSAHRASALISIRRGNAMGRIKLLI
jgi:serine protease Do